MLRIFISICDLHRRSNFLGFLLGPVIGFCLGLAFRLWRPVIEFNPRWCVLLTSRFPLLLYLPVLCGACKLSLARIFRGSQPEQRGVEFFKEISRNDSPFTWENNELQSKKSIGSEESHIRDAVEKYEQ